MHRVFWLVEHVMDVYLTQSRDESSHGLELRVFVKAFVHRSSVGGWVMCKRKQTGAALETRTCGHSE